MKDLTILVCLYNKSIEESNTLQSILSSSKLLNNVNIILWDNSLIPLRKDQIEFLRSELKLLNYISTPENIPLSQIYNTVIEKQMNPNGYLMLCDDDSIISNIFFEELFIEIKKNTYINLFLPKVIINETIISPAKDYILFSKFFNNLQSGVTKSNKITAINSCMIISNRVFFDGFKYDVRLQFYGTDNYFMFIFRARYSELFILKNEIKHNLSFNSSSEINNKLRIFREIRKANNIVYESNYIYKNIVKLNNLIVAIKYCLRFRTLAFLYD